MSQNKLSMSSETQHDLRGSGIDNEMDVANGRCQGRQSSKTNKTENKLKTRSGKIVKPSAVIREASTSGESSTGVATPVKRKNKSKNKNVKRTIFSCQSSTDSANFSSHETKSQSSVGQSDNLEDGEYSCSQVSDAVSTINLSQVLTESDDGDTMNVNDNAACDRSVQSGKKG